jgi:Ca2+-binding RTX toxin-like protein
MITNALRLSFAVGVVALAGAGLPNDAVAAPFCAYDSGTNTVTATLGAGESATLDVTASGGIRFGASPSPCGAATTGNTDTVIVTGAPGSTEHLLIDQFGGPLAPGATPEGSGLSELEVQVGLGDTSDEVVVQGGPDAEPLAAGTKGVAFNADADVDVTFSPLPGSIELVAAGGMSHILSARGGYGSGRVFPGPVTLRAGNLGDSLTGSDFADLLIGGNGPDFMHGSSGDDVIRGANGNDKLRGADGNDSIFGGQGADTFSGSYGDDVFDAHDGDADVQLNGGPGVDTAAYDRGLDPAPIAVENRFPLDPSPPPPPPDPDPVTACGYTGGVVTATIAPGEQATLKVVAGQILFGAPAVACGAATTSNTDEIEVTGATDSRERLVIDLRTGALAPGATPDASGQSEIEVGVDLRDVVDAIRVIGPDSGAFFVAGSRGMSLNADGDVDVTVEPAALLISLVGGSEVDRLSARGGFGAGRPFAGSATLRGGDSADILLGGNRSDRMWGGQGVDRLRGAPGHDHLVGGDQADFLWGGRGDDVLRAVDQLADRRIDGDGGRDTAYFDRGRDVPVQCEVRLARPR